MSSAVAELLSKREAIQDRVTALHAELEEVKRDLSAVDHVLKLFDPSYSVSARLQPHRRPRGGGLEGLFDHGEVSEGIMAALREASGPVTARECAERVAQSKGIAATDPCVVTLANRASTVLCGFADRGRVRRIRSQGSREVRWEITPMNGPPPFVSARGQAPR